MEPEPLQKVNLADKFTRFDDHWHPRIVGALNGQHVKVVKLLGEFVWHQHANEDELFWVLRGALQIELRDQVITLTPGEFLIVPRGVEHRPVAEAEVWVALFESAATVNTGDVREARTRGELEWL